MWGKVCDSHDYNLVAAIERPLIQWFLTLELLIPWEIWELNAFFPWNAYTHRILCTFSEDSQNSLETSSCSWTLRWLVTLLNSGKILVHVFPFRIEKFLFGNRLKGRSEASVPPLVGPSAFNIWERIQELAQNTERCIRHSLFSQRKLDVVGLE